MTTVRFPVLLGAELRLVLCERLTWAVLAALVVSLCLAAWTGAGRVATERAALAQAAADTDRVVRDARAAHERYAEPSPIKVNY